MSRDEQRKLLRQCAFLFARKKVCNEPNPIAWLRIVYQAHRLGFLYCGFGPKKNIDLACIAYRCDDFDPSLKVVMPEKEKGHILYVVAVASVSKNSRKLFHLMRWYLREQPEVEKIVYHVRNSDECKVHNLRRIKING